MVERIAGLLERYLNFPPELTIKVLRRAIVGLAAAFFVLVSTVTVAFDTIFSVGSVSSLRIGDIAPTNIVAPPEPAPFYSEILTEQARQEARNSVSPVYDPPDPNIVRQQTQLARQTLDFINNVRRDPFSTSEQKSDDIQYLITVTLDEAIIDGILRLDDETWLAIDDEIINVLPRVMRETIRQSDVQTIRDQLPTQVSIRFDAPERDLVVAIVEDLIRPNTFENPEKTEIARNIAAESVLDVERSFARGQIIIFQGEQVDTLAYEALQELGLLTPDDLRVEMLWRALLASIVVMIIIGLYITRFQPHLVYLEPRFLTLLATFFLVVLITLRAFGLNGDAIYLFPAAAMGLTYVSVTSSRIALISSLCLALLAGLMMRNSLEITTFIATGGFIGVLALRRPDRFNNFFAAGFLIGLMNVAVLAIFHLGVRESNDVVFLPMVAGFVNGVLFVPAVSFATMYLLTVAFNLPTPLKLVDLSQPNKPLLQRLLREAPGTYQHSLQVANLAEQAAHAIRADAQLTHVAALYHDIGKMLNPIFFSENQQDTGNPHETLNDPYRSADIIISHVTGGDEMARQYRLPNRIRDFIREHHGTTQVFVFYQRAIERAGGDTSAVDVSDFTYPGPKPRSRETAILMMADSCESAVRASKPQSRQEVTDIVRTIIETKRKAGQLDDSGLTLNELKIIENIFMDILQAVFHPRIDYREAISRSKTKTKTETLPKVVANPKSDPKIPKVSVTDSSPDVLKDLTKTRPKLTTTEIQAANPKGDPSRATNDEAPMPIVPPLPRAGAKRNANGESNGKPPSESKKPVDGEPEKDENK